MKILTRTIAFTAIVGIIFGTRIALANNPPCNFSASPAGPYCPGATVTFTATPCDWCVDNNAITNYAWTVDGGTVVINSGSVITISVGNTLGTGALQVSLNTFDLNSCTSGDNPCAQTYDIVCGTVNASPVGADIGGGTHVYCAGQGPITLTATNCAGGIPSWVMTPECSGCSFSSSGTTATFTPDANFAGTATITAISGNCTTTVTIVVVKVNSVTVVSGATQANVTGAKNWAVVKGTGDVIVEATLTPNTDAAASCMTWSTGSPVSGNSRQRKISKTASAEINVTATCGSTSDYVDIWILWSTLTVHTSGPEPADAHQLDTLHGGPTLGPYENTTRVGASMTLSAAITPTGVHNVVQAGWDILRTVTFQSWRNSGGGTVSSNGTDIIDTSFPPWKVLTPTSCDAIYDTDAPNNTVSVWFWVETHNNNTQWVEWGGTKCSLDATWYVQYKYSKNSLFTTTYTRIYNQIGPGFITIPTSPTIP